jgi:hypothetical protein
MDGSTQDPSVLDLVVEGLANGRLWPVEAGPVWIGPGTVGSCLVCRLKINSHELQYDVPGPRGALPAHATCYVVWRKLSDKGRRKAE